MNNHEGPLSFFAVGFLLVTSLIAGIIAAVITYLATNYNPYFTSIAFIVTALVHPFIGALVVSFCEKFKRWAYLGKDKKWDREEKAFIGSLWPFTLCGCVIFFIFVGITNRIY
jgi:hypothetical protein